jgi:2-polyprenyl-3-methyl-5-hydroxy-6-metoxy-1,4-benzoquinol methylase
MNNGQLRKFYDAVYRKGETKHYTKLLLSKGKVTGEKLAVLNEMSWKGKDVLDFGCGTGEVSSLIAKRGAKSVLGIDYAPKAIEVANRLHQNQNLSFTCANVKNIHGRFDVVIALGTLEHMDNPLAALKKLKSLLKPKGSIIITVPNWVNARGYMLMTLQGLFGARITLADIHYLTPINFMEWAKALRMKLTWKTVDHDWSEGKRLVQDFAKRLPNVLKDSGLPNNAKKIESFVKWVEKHIVPFKSTAKHSGAIGMYHLKK